MKFLTITIGVCLSISSFAESLEQIAQSQNATTISPVFLNQTHFLGDNAASVCGAMGFVRLVDFATEPCEEGETLGYFTTPTDEPTYKYDNIDHNNSNLPPVICGTRPNRLKRLKSVTCAK
jgi:hypothetical protein